MIIRIANEADYTELALMKWKHGAEDDIDYGEHNLDGVDKESFINEFISFLNKNKEYQIVVAEENGIVVSAMFVYLIPKLPKPKGNAKYIAYLTNVYTKKEYRNKGIGTRVLEYIKSDLIEKKCELLFAWPSDNSIAWYQRNGFNEDNELFECPLCEE
ncbi:MAG: GNAT family N-acetyltransferase [Acutalibacteraceae bacterium]|uniref:GNAT family N-acetyltransferase n=1 Tax=Ruminococcus sp. TaxID=41978 RepID=UPI002E77B848|nr:GNAT family N-acetyltransferase [Ruminococcus sp.]MEE1057430.1 GNAT family N-acetyltransferase [Acutalibacteraceae bacterium]MEE1263728.1 GNAT family N-acetyltransferase [Ruminococcus sp.]